MRNLIIVLTLLIPCLSEGGVHVTPAAGALTDSITFTTSPISFPEIRTAIMGSQGSAAATGAVPLLINSGFGGTLNLNTISTGPIVMSLNPASNVGIKTANPALPLDVNGAAQFGAGATKSTFTAAGSLFMASGSSLTFSGDIGITYASFFTRLNGSGPGLVRSLHIQTPGGGGAQESIVIQVPDGVNPAGISISTKTGGISIFDDYGVIIGANNPGFDGVLGLSDAAGDSGFSLHAEPGFGFTINDDNTGTSIFEIENGSQEGSLAIRASGEVQAISSMTASAFFGDGSHLTFHGDGGGVNPSLAVVGPISISGTGSPTQAHALCINAAGKLSTCSSAVAADGSCTCN